MEKASEGEVQYGFLQLSETEYQEAVASQRYPDPKRYEQLTGYFPEPHGPDWKGRSLAEMFPTRYKDLQARGVPDQLSPVQVESVVKEGRIPYEGLTPVSQARGIGEKNVEKEGKMELPIDQVLDTVAERLEKGTRDPKAGADLSGQVKQFSDSYSKLIHQMRQCQNVSKNLDTLVTAVIPLGKKLASDVWDALEMMGLWSAETESISALLTKTLVTQRFMDDTFDAITTGCECRKPLTPKVPVVYTGQ